ncbi:hypothetical protein CHLNCDRAFT_143682 [Chlorella variabilis]|uniref:PIH1 N-terminal domain-containing protein n=1 Tax=Chlorella variabilis TaxID=554065 RepID=E1ZA86_CHLVA|nr:hypothetical protein CHLNCDRAFT_143682 [Chlorella variabilis]EFN57014.1 hypothetical protein CHLNCDRAFT_143682 [Chlorella variabilis]|eukprot:XP_005849116.1 hypothetical protein CHLNCDRAFT_143682 [Chlorella variabilis]
MQAGPPGGVPLPDDQLEVFPEPGFVIKTANEQGQKVFINLCGTNKLPLPPGWVKGQVPAEVKRHLEVGRGGEAPPCMRFPLSMGLPRLDTDHRGEVCMVLDCIISSEVLAQASQYRPLKFFIIQLALGTAAQMTGQELNPQYKLPKMRYKGDAPPPQRIRLEGDAAARQQQQQRPGSAGGPGKRLIAEVPAEGEEPSFALLASKRQQRQRRPEQAAVAATNPIAQATEPAVPQGGIADGPEQQVAQPAARPAQQQQGPPEQLHPLIEYRGKPATCVAITVPLPAAAAAAAQRDPGAIGASVCAEVVRVQAPGCQPLEVQLPFAVSAAGATAEVTLAAAPAGKDKAGSSLVLTLPYRPFSSVLDELRQAASAADGAMQHSSPGSNSLSQLD